MVMAIKGLWFFLSEISMNSHADFWGYAPEKTSPQSFCPLTSLNERNGLNDPNELNHFFFHLRPKVLYFFRP
jgi:hypothetical protein